MFSQLVTLSILLASHHVLGAPLERRQAGADFGSCTTPEITFGAGIEGRRETAFIPTDLKSFNHGSAQNINIITQFMCDNLTNSCKANQAAKDQCTQAQAAASAATAKTGAQADAFNGVFGISTNFNAIQPLDDQGRPVGAAGAGNAGAGTGNAAAGGADTGAAAGGAAAGGSNAGNGTAAGGAAGGADAGAEDFGSCTTPEITFAAGLDGRRETAFVPTDLQSFNHGSAQNINIITQFICDTLTNSCKANQAAKDKCTQAQTAASAATAKTGAQADAFNGVFGITTNFNAVQPLDDQGQAVGAAGAGNAGAAAGGADTGAAAGGANAGNAGAAGAAGGAATGAADFGSCTTPEITFAAGLDGREETAFVPTDLQSFNHGSAQNIDIITQFICDTLTNSCKANQAAKDQCTQAQAAADGATAKTGAQADAFNGVFGITTNFNAVQPLDDQGQAVGAAGAATGAAGAGAGNANAGGANTGVAATGGADAGNAGNSGAAAGNAAGGANAGAANGDDLQTFTGALGGVAAPPVTAGGSKGFVVEGNDEFVNLAAALQRSCAVQHNACADAANSGAANISVGQCDAQEQQCVAA